MDRFSKVCCLVPLKGLPTAMETADVLFNHVFRTFGIPDDIVSDRGPQFLMGLEDFLLLGVTVSLSSGYHPQSNGQMEIKIQEIGCYLCTFGHSHLNSWNQFIAWAEYASISPLRISPPSSAYSATSHLCSPGLGNLRRYQQSLIGYKRVRGSGTQHINILSVQYDVTNIMQMSKEPPLPPTTQDRRYGSPPGTSD